MFILSMMKSGISSSSRVLQKSDVVSDMSFNTGQWVFGHIGDGMEKDEFVNTFCVGRNSVDNWNNIVYQDWPICLSKVWKKLVEWFPNEKYILTTRPVDDWFKSFKNWHHIRNMHPMNLNCVWNEWLGGKFPYSDNSYDYWNKIEITKEDEKFIKNKYLEHNDEVINYGIPNLFHCPLYDANINEFYDFLEFPSEKRILEEWPHANKTKVFKI